VTLRKGKRRRRGSKEYDIQAVINTILRLSLEELALEALLDRTLGLILSIPWLALKPEAAYSSSETSQGSSS